MKYEIKNLTTFSKGVGKAVAEDLDIKTNELSDYISVKNVKGIARQFCVYNKHRKKYIASEKILESIVDETRNWILGLQLARECGSNKLECAWDNERDCMIFWKNKERGNDAQEKTD